MTDRLYYTDAYLTEFDASVVRVEPRATALAVTLDRTAFYPSSGGQPFDVGAIDGRQVIDVLDEEGEVVHLVPVEKDEKAETDPLLVGRRVHGVVDWVRRFDHMQQHSGQHVLSAAFDKLCRARTISFHLGAEVSTIDLEREVNTVEIAAAEDEANRIVWADRPLAVRFVTPEEAASLPLRKEPTREGTLRLVDIENVDLSACGGTHVARTGAIGTIAVTASERFKGGQRVEFACGRRTLARFRSLRASTEANVRLLSVLPHEVPDAVERLQADAKAQRRTLAALQTELAGYRAVELRERAEGVPAGRLVAAVYDGDALLLKALASAIIAAPGHLAVLVSAIRPVLVIVGRSVGVSMSADRVLTDLILKFGGRGGGRPELAQGGGLDAEPHAVLAEARRLIAALP